jgi:hypothetical protein
MRFSPPRHQEHQGHQEGIIFESLGVLGVLGALVVSLPIC